MVDSSNFEEEEKPMSDVSAAIRPQRTASTGSHEFRRLSVPQRYSIVKKVFRELIEHPHDQAGVCARCNITSSALNLIKAANNLMKTSSSRDTVGKPIPFGVRLQAACVTPMDPVRNVEFSTLEAQGLFSFNDAGRIIPLDPPPPLEEDVKPEWWVPAGILRKAGVLRNHEESAFSVEATIPAISGCFGSDKVEVIDDKLALLALARSATTLCNDLNRLRREANGIRFHLNLDGSLGVSIDAAQLVD